MDSNTLKMNHLFNDAIFGQNKQICHSRDAFTSGFLYAVALFEQCVDRIPKQISPKSKRGRSGTVNKNSAEFRVRGRIETGDLMLLRNLADLDNETNHKNCQNSDFFEFGATSTPETNEHMINQSTNRTSAKRDKWANFSMLVKSKSTSNFGSAKNNLRRSKSNVKRDINSFKKNSDDINSSTSDQYRFTQEMPQDENLLHRLDDIIYWYE